WAVGSRRVEDAEEEPPPSRMRAVRLLAGRYFSGQPTESARAVLIEEGPECLLRARDVATIMEGIEKYLAKHRHSSLAGLTHKQPGTRGNPLFRIGEAPAQELLPDLCPQGLLTQTHGLTAGLAVRRDAPPTNDATKRFRWDWHARKELQVKQPGQA